MDQWDPVEACPIQESLIIHVRGRARGQGSAPPNGMVSSKDKSYLEDLRQENDTVCYSHQVVLQGKKDFP